MNATLFSEMSQQINRIQAMRAALRAEAEHIQQTAGRDVSPRAFRCVYMRSVDGKTCGQCGQPRSAHN